MERKICINGNPGFKDVSFAQTLDSLGTAGFDGIFTGWHVGGMKKMVKMIRERGLYFQSVHAPFTKMHLPWEKGKAGDAAIDELIDCVRECAEVEAPIVVIHPIIGMDRHNPTDLGIERFGRLVRVAEELGIKLAFENVEGIEYLEKIIAELGSSSASISAGGNSQSVQRNAQALTAELRAITARMRELLGLPAEQTAVRRTSDLPDFLR